MSKRKILFLDNIEMRPEKYLGNSSFEKFSSLVEYKNDILSYVEFFTKGDFQCIQNFKIIFVHHSEFGKLMTSHAYKLFDSFRVVNDIQLVLFSGDIFYNQYNERNLSLRINDITLYRSETLLPFLTKMQNDDLSHIHLTELLYGEKWKLSYLFRAQQLLDLESRGQDLFEVTDSDRNINLDDILDEAKEVIRLENLDEVKAEIENQMMNL